VGHFCVDPRKGVKLHPRKMKLTMRKSVPYSVMRLSPMKRPLSRPLGGSNRQNANPLGGGRASSLDLGSVKFYRKFIEKYSNICAPPALADWDEDCVKSFNTLRIKSIETPILSGSWRPDYSCMFELHTDCRSRSARRSESRVCGRVSSPVTAIELSKLNPTTREMVTSYY
jgi:hypothetical protein